MVCLNGHEFDERIFRSGKWRCPTCVRESDSRRQKRYYMKQKHGW